MNIASEAAEEGAVVSLHVVFALHVVALNEFGSDVV